MQVFWFIPTHGDSRYLGTAEGARAATADTNEKQRRSSRRKSACRSRLRSIR